MFLAEIEKLRDACHRAVVIHNLAYYRGGFEIGEFHQVDSPFGLPCADEDPAITGAKREDVAGTREIGRFRVVGDGGLNCVGAVGGADTGGDTLCGVDTDGEGGVEPSGVVEDLRVKGESVAFFAGQRQADEAPPEFGHKVYCLRRYFFRGADEVAFVFAVFIVNQDNQFARAKVVKDIRYLAELDSHRIKD